MIWVFIVIVFVLFVYLWAEIYKLQVMLASIILKEKAEDMYEEIIKDLNFKGGHYTEKD